MPFLVKKYYETPVKSQFREVTNEIIAKNNNKSKVVNRFYELETAKLSPALN